jgi:hypothetical protein
MLNAYMQLTRPEMPVLRTLRKLSLRLYFNISQSREELTHLH